MVQSWGLVGIQVRESKCLDCVRDKPLESKKTMIKTSLGFWSHVSTKLQGQPPHYLMLRISK